jgi:hypothetical protein
VTGAGVGVGVVALLRDERWRRRLEGAAEGIRATVMPNGGSGGPVQPVDRPPVGTEDEAHAPGHRHLPAPSGEGAPVPGPDDRHTGVDHHHGRKG